MHPDMVHISIQADDVVVSMEGLCHHTAERLMLIPGKMLSLLLMISISKVKYFQVC